jgi:hypothetical protein
MSIRTYIAETCTEFPHDAPDVNARRVGERVLEEFRTKAALWDRFLPSVEEACQTQPRLVIP